MQLCSRRGSSRRRCAVTDSCGDTGLGGDSSSVAVTTPIQQQHRQLQFIYLRRLQFSGNGD
ncbi:hypothetical protein LINGRAHAP2_LOCUS13965 [Linum grandiflorum]